MHGHLLEKSERIDAHADIFDSSVGHILNNDINIAILHKLSGRDLSVPCVSREPVGMIVKYDNRWVTSMFKSRNE